MRDTYIVRNNTRRPIVIGDLPFCPTIDPGKTQNLLNYYNTTQLNASSDLAKLCQANLLSLVVSRDGSTKTNVVSKEVLKFVTTDEMRQASAEAAQASAEAALDNTLGIVSKTSDYNIQVSDEIIIVDSTANTILLNLPDSADATGQVYNVKRINDGSYDVTVMGLTGQQIDGENTVIIGSQYTNLTILSDGSSWHII